MSIQQDFGIVAGRLPAGDAHAALARIGAEIERLRDLLSDRQSDIDIRVRRQKILHENRLQQHLLLGFEYLDLRCDLI